MKFKSLALVGALGLMGRSIRFDRPDRSEEGFEEQVLGHLSSHKKSVAELTSNIDQLDKKTKAAFDDLTTIKNGFGSLEEKVNALQRVNLQLRNEHRSATSGGGVRRILGDPEKRQMVGALIRRACAHRSPVKYSPAQQKALEGVDSPGSTYFTDTLVPELYDTLPEYGIFSTFAQKRLGARVNLMPVKSARAAAAFTTTEGGAIPEDAAKAGASVTATVQTAAALISVSNELIQDSMIDISEDVLTDFFEAMALLMDQSCLTANGTADAANGGFTGIFVGGTASVAAAGHTTIETMTLDDFIRVLTTVDAGVLNRKAAWWVHPRNLARMLSIKDANGRPIFLTAIEAPTPMGIGSILGYPVIPSYAAPSTDAASNAIAAFGDPNGLVFGIRQDFEFASSTHASFNDNETVFRGVARFASKIRKAGAFAVLKTPAS